MLHYVYFTYFHAFFGLGRTGVNKIHCVNDLKQHLVNIWQSAAEHHGRGHQKMEKVTGCVRAYRWTTF